ncbi:protein kinase, partial [Porticoccaceae bacterium]|nr:protein kinase [Porticoccaceae bacterium]
GLAKVRSEEGAPSDIDDMSSESLTEDPTMTGFQKLQGTIAYMSPEQIKKAPDIDGRTDIYSLGVVLYEALTGVKPSLGDTMDKIKASTLNDIPLIPSEISTTPISQVLDDIVMQCLAKDANKRMQSVGELIRLLKEGLGV